MSNQAPNTLSGIDWDGLDEHKYISDDEICQQLLADQPLSPTLSAAALAEAETLVRQTRIAAKRQGMVESFLKEFSLGTREGLALMCLAEALLRTPDEATKDDLIAEKIAPADWESHLGRSDNWFVNASTLGLMLTGRVVDVEEQAKGDLKAYLTQLAARLGEPVIRKAVAQAIRIMGEQFVLGRNLQLALKRAQKEDYLCSFDMLGEGARTEADALRYSQSYADAIDTLARFATKGPEADHGISVKLSALYARYEAVKEVDVFETLYPRILGLAIKARHADLNFTLDAEESDRLVISLRLLERLCYEPELKGWKGLGLAVQAYQKRCPSVIETLKKLAQASGQRLMVRLVKGAYWDTEIKRAQVMGRTDYPVHTQKAATDLSYLVCAKALIAASPHLYGQFATHNAHTFCAVRRMAEEAKVVVEFQRLHGMGETLYAQAQDMFAPFPLRAYAPVGGHEDLLPYLVRRLLENGANSSFVHNLLDETIDPKDVVRDPVKAVEIWPHRHPKLPLPLHIYPDRPNSLGPDISQAISRDRFESALLAFDQDQKHFHPLIGGTPRQTAISVRTTSPANRSMVIADGHDADTHMINDAFDRAATAQKEWDRSGGAARAKILDAMADGLMSRMDKLCACLVREAGKTWADAISEVREAADFCRYYARLAHSDFDASVTLKGPVGETNQLIRHGRGVMVCISPWNFPLAIFTGQIAACLAAGNAVLAKPAEQTPLIAYKACKIFYGAGLKPDLLALIPGAGDTIGQALCEHKNIAGVCFTGGTITAQAISRTLAAKSGPIVPLVAETGGLNAMFVDTSALKEQVIDDVIQSAFGSAGQRCSALRLLFVPQEQADDFIKMLTGAMSLLTVGCPARFDTDIGPVIDAEAGQALKIHIDNYRAKGKLIYQSNIDDGLTGDFVAPSLIDLDGPHELTHEVFGPVLHIVRYDSQNPKKWAETLAATGYGLTLGVHSRLESFAQEIMDLVPAGNVYINRSMTGAVVGVQPFGGGGLSGTGPKAGGPWSLTRLAHERCISNNITAQGGDPALLNL